MYAYCRFWDAEKALLLYPGQANENKFRSYLADDYSKDTENDPLPIDHHCKMGFVSVLNEKNELDYTIGENILNLLE